MSALRHVGCESFTLGGDTVALNVPPLATNARIVVFDRPCAFATGGDIMSAMNLFLLEPGHELVTASPRALKLCGRGATITANYYAEP